MSSEIDPGERLDHYHVHIHDHGRWSLIGPWLTDCLVLLTECQWSEILKWHSLTTTQVYSWQKSWTFNDPMKLRILVGMGGRCGQAGCLGLFCFLCGWESSALHPPAPPTSSTIMCIVRQTIQSHPTHHHQEECFFGKCVQFSEVLALHHTSIPFLKYWILDSQWYASSVDLCALQCHRPSHCLHFWAAAHQG